MAPKAPVRRLTLGSRKILPDVVTDETLVRSAAEKATHNSEKEDYFNELTQLAEDLNFAPVIHKMTLTNMLEEIDGIPLDELVFNLCDGCDLDGVCGPSVAAYLEQRLYPNVVGCDLQFINNTLTKAGMKELFLKHHVSCPPGFAATTSTDLDAEVTSWGMTYPLFVKVSDSYGSVGIDDNSVCHDSQALHDKCTAVFQEFANLVVEEYIDGPEFSVLISGDSRDPNCNVVVYPPAERAFNKDLPRFQRFISYLRNWDESLLAHHYASVTDYNDVAALQDLARRAYIACSGNSFGRVDVRKRDTSGKFYVLEVNASCGLGKGSSSDFILGLAGQSTKDFFQILLSSALKPPAASEEDGDLVSSPTEVSPTTIPSTTLPPTEEPESSEPAVPTVVLPPEVENRVQELLKNPSLHIFPTPILHVIVAAVMLEDEGIPEPEMSLREAWGKDVVYVSELEQAFRSLGFDPIVHLHHFDDIEATLDGLSPDEDLVVNACLGADGSEVAQLLEQRGFKSHVGLNAAFFRHSRNRITMREHLKANRLRIPVGVALNASDDVAKVVKGASLEFPVYVKPATSHRHVEGGYAGRKVWTLEGLQAYLKVEEDVVVEEFISGVEFKALVAGDGRDPRADIIVFPAVQIIKPTVEEEPTPISNDRDLDPEPFTTTATADNADGSSPRINRKSSFIPSLLRRMTSTPIFTTATPPIIEPKYVRMTSESIMTQLDIQDVARRAYVAVEGSCYGIVSVIQSGGVNGELVVLGVSSDIKFGGGGSAGAILALAGLNAEALWSWLLKRVGSAKELGRVE
ncbi:D-alanine---D-alanine ligase [Synchytrium microbalum]|uniref:D-alanine---D-alanine ligase n=1 Tax=Synchytrium microbalum TaxID=1806994 RepID=A0A507BJC5_9FUNG|nr:D-alanine---D-alanine ligase [Synchytrium microbalum]TPX30710.1 D-alanine---D-alanine ligase [Synchytrium microbalum]